jgi:hypothetical protein
MERDGAFFLDFPIPFSIFSRWFGLYRLTLLTGWALGFGVEKMREFQGWPAFFFLGII